MCGIFGSIGWDKPADTDDLRAMDRSLVHRGPDDGTAYVAGGVALGSRRLSIVDPNCGRQPFTSDDGSIVVVCNGEIYNHDELRDRLRGHRFRSRCDVEILPHLYQEQGISFLHELNGQFALAIHDRRRNTVILARDRFGICPLYYQRQHRRTRFASEIKALLTGAGPAGDIDPRGLDQALALPSVVSPQTMYAGIASVRPGHYLELSPEEGTEHEYWDLEYPCEQDLAGTATEQQEQYQSITAALSDAVRRRLQGDARIGLYISGGLDSALIASLAARQASPHVSHLLSVGFQQTELDESHHQRAVAQHLRLPHQHVEVSTEDVCQRLEETVAHAEVPMRESYNVASLMLADTASRAGLKVVLSGEGADELFAGYSGYRFDKLRQGLGPRPVPAAVQDRRRTLWGDPHYGYDLDLDALQDTRLSLYSSELRLAFPEFDFTRSPLVRSDRVRGRHIMHQRSYLDVKLRMSDHLLGDHGDRMTMARSIESRYPFLDPQVVALATALHPDVKLRDFDEKHALKRAAAGWVPESVIAREKFPFTAPSSPYLVRHAPAFVRDRLSPTSLRHHGLFDPARVTQLIDTYADPAYNPSTPLRTDWLMLVLTATMLVESQASRPHAHTAVRPLALQPAEAPLSA